MSKVRVKKSSSLKKTTRLNSGIKKLQSEFISSTSHQFRTPLSTIQSSVELLEFYIKRENTARQLEIIDKIKRSIFSLTDTLERITSLYKNSSLKEKLILKRTDPRKMINELLQEIVINISDSHFIITDLDPQLKSIKCNEFIVKQILLNLIHNSVKFSPQGGQIKISVKRDKKWIEFAVRDEGIGISKNDLSKIFHPFFRGKNTGTVEGVGLGLAIVKNLSTIHKGKIECTSNLEKGTEFRFKIRA
jgi:signal transduction histidine kinase